MVCESPPQGMRSLNYLVGGGCLCPDGWVSELFMYLHLRMWLRGRQDGPHSHRA